MVIIQVSSTLYPSCSFANIFDSWKHSVDNKFRILIRVGPLTIIWSFWLFRNDKVFYDKIHHLCMSSTSVQLCSIHGHLYNMFTIVNYL
jgi:hypothetical protein